MAEALTRPWRTLAAIACTVTLLTLGSAVPAANASSVDPALLTGLNGVVALSPPDTCLRVDVGGAPVFSHASDLPLIPASTQKLVTAAVALDVLGADHRFRTPAVSAPPVAGVVNGDLALVGSGDPLLTTVAYAFARRIGADQPVTNFDSLADQVVAAGVKRITGRVVGDESRYDSLRAVPTWPPRYSEQNQIGPLSALSVDDGYRLEPRAEDQEPLRVRSVDPAADAAATFSALLQSRGVVVDGGSAAGRAPAGAVEVASVESAPLSKAVRQMLEQSDNGTAELLARELGVAQGGAGTTAAGASVIQRRATELGLITKGPQIVDGSGLDRGNRATCDELIAVLNAGGGSNGAIATSLPIAGRTGTLKGRFRGTAAQDRLRAKTGSLNDVTALAGYVAMADGQTATFAYIANGPQADDPRKGQDFLGILLGQHEKTCPEPTGPMVVPLTPYTAQVGLLSGIPMAALMIPALAIPLDAIEGQASSMVDPCLAADPEFTLALR
ncbi:MAG: D-alanyl-D-alanine carboxypeptidase/D-alanyl-D-alanine-endopeptidase [Aquihabitans sp.]